MIIAIKVLRWLIIGSLMAETGSETEQAPVRATTKELVSAFCLDMKPTFPELESTFDSVSSLDDDVLTAFMKKTFPPVFFDILYKNEKLFTGEAELLPSIDFKFICERRISDSTRDSIWQHLQLLMFSVVAEIEDASAFGDAETFFQAVDTDTLREKLEEVLGDTESAGPNPQFMEEHLEGLLGGKIGALAKDIATEAASDLGDLGDLGEGLDDEADMKDVFSRLLGDPMRLMNLIKRIGSRIEREIKSGNLKESELLEEASSLLEKMRTTPGMEGLGEMMAKMGVSNQRDVKRAQSQVAERLKTAKTKDRLRAKLAQRRAARDARDAQESVGEAVSEEAAMVEAEDAVLANAEHDQSKTLAGGKKRRKKKKKRPAKPPGVGSNSV